MENPRLEDLLEEHRGTLHTYVAYRWNGARRHKEAVSDIVQSAFRELLANPGNFRYQGPEAFRAFLIRAVEHKLANKRRYWEAQKRGAGQHEPVSDLDGAAPANGTVPTPSEVVAQQESLTRLAAALEKLSDDDRKLLTMRRFAELSISVIAAELDQPPSTVRSRLGRIMTQLGRELGRSGDADGCAGASADV